MRTHDHIANGASAGDAAKKGITVYCASSDKIAPLYFDTAYDLGARIAGMGLPVVNGGGRMGLMRAVSDGALDSGGEAIGVIPGFMVEARRNYPRLTRTIVTETMAERKTVLADLSCAVIALPGGVGTLEEIAEMMTKRKLGLYDGEVIILNIAGYYDDLLRMLERSRAEGFTHGAPSWRVCATVQEAIDAISHALGR